MRGPVPAGRSRCALHWLAAVLATLALASPTWATASSGGWLQASSGAWSGSWAGGWTGHGFGRSLGGWLGISLADLAEGESFESLDGAFTFSGFEVDASGSATRNLNLYWVVPLDDGFKLVAPMGALFGSHGELDLSYEVMANEQADQGFLVEAMSMSILGFTLGSGAELKAIADLFDPNNPGVPLLADPLEVEARSLFGGGQGSGEESSLLTPPLQQILVEELVAVASGGPDAGMGGTGTGGKTTGRHEHHQNWSGLAMGAVVTHRFATVVPEPTTALLLGGGLLGLVALERHRRLGRSPRR